MAEDLDCSGGSSHDVSIRTAVGRTRGVSPRRKRSTASQYALLTSLCALPGSFIAGSSGFVIEQLGFAWFFVATSLIGAPVAILCWYVWRLQERMGERSCQPHQGP